MDAYLREGKLDGATYREQIERFDSETNGVQAQLRVATPERIDLDGALNFAERVLADPGGCWERLTPEQRPGFQQAVYPSGLRYQNGSLVTAESPWAFGYLQEFTDTKTVW